LNIFLDILFEISVLFGGVHGSELVEAKPKSLFCSEFWWAWTITYTWRRLKVH